MARFGSQNNEKPTTEIMTFCRAYALFVSYTEPMGGWPLPTLSVHMASGQFFFNFHLLQKTLFYQKKIEFWKKEVKDSFCR